jgi:hypothetical protein
MNSVEEKSNEVGFISKMLYNNIVDNDEKSIFCDFSIFDKNVNG